MGINLESRRIRRLNNQVPVSGWSRNPGASRHDQPVCVHTLGRFAVQFNQQPLNFTQSRQQRPFALLQSLIASGGRDVHIEQLAQMLWPDADGDAARNSFDVTLHRLRRVFGLSELFQLRDGRLTLNSSLVWVDAWSFERLVNYSEQLLARAHDPAINHQLVRCSERLLTLYQGSFLEREAIQPWMLSMRERLRSKLLRYLLEAGQVWQNLHDWDRAIRFYRKGLEIEPFSERLHQQLIMSYRDCGQRSEALASFQRCRQLLEEHFQIPPADATLALYYSIKS
jgi:DNA-binding SARP family transcriptional activator